MPTIVAHSGSHDQSNRIAGEVDAWVICPLLAIPLRRRLIEQTGE